MPTVSYNFLGKPKFKITETEYGSGWSIYIGYGNNKYIRLNYGDIPSIDINILNHKGSLKLMNSDYLYRHVDGKYQFLKYYARCT